mmetsp:Transcript_5194/g.11336  ORF Transcript_5194/g.11336 Transcript_5194/m.11336 type:complete len:253 (-) Transcript_5194:2-760(-)
MNAYRAASASEKPLGLAARKAAIIEETRQPAAVIFVSISTPCSQLETCPVGLTTKSTAPEMQTTQLYLAAKLLAAFRAAPEPCEESTPLVSPAAPATARISEALPRSTEHPPMSKSSVAVVVLRAVNPAATGSRTHGTPFALQVLAANLKDSIQVGSSVPMLIETAPFIAATTSIADSSSSTAWTMAGEAPSARRPLAMKSMDTKLVRHCTSGAFAFTARTISWSFSTDPFSSIAGVLPVLADMAKADQCKV